MNELQVKTIELEPAKVVFNHEEIEKDLEKNLQKYSGLTFTEDDAAECKKVIAELRKGKKAVDDYRKQTKKELTAPITEFENKCKSLNKRFDEVISPLVEQHESFEQKRKDEKRAKVEQVIAELIERQDLSEKYANQMVVEDSHLAKSKSMKSIEEELETQAQHLKMQQDKEESDKQVIQSSVQYINSSYNVSLSENPYINLLDYKDLKDIKVQILDDGQVEADKRLQEEKRKEEQRKKEQEVKQAEYEHELAQSDAEPEQLEEIPFIPDDDDIAPDPFITKEERTYEVSGTDEQLEKLELFMNQNGINWSIADYE